MKRGDKVLWDSDFNFLEAIYVETEPKYGLITLEFLSGTPKAYTTQVVPEDVFKHSIKKLHELESRYGK